ncbi:hypothetical protein ES708_04071 [subsurface metagenome]
MLGKELYFGKKPKNRDIAHKTNPLFHPKKTSKGLVELYLVRERLSEHGGDRRSINDANAPLKIWKDYCNDIGVDKSTANRWLARYGED